MKRTITIALISMSLVGCAALRRNVAPTSHPGQISDFDGYTADVLYTSQVTLEQLNAKVADYPTALAPLRQATADYNVAYRTYLLYRCAQGKPGDATGKGSACPPNGQPVSQTQVQTATEALVRSLATAEKVAKVGGK